MEVRIEMGLEKLNRLSSQNKFSFWWITVYVGIVDNWKLSALKEGTVPCRCKYDEYGCGCSERYTKVRVK